jgi:hypothetical protein
VDEDVPQPRNPARWLAWAVAGLLTAGAVSAGAVNARDGRADDRIVTAADETADGIEAATTSAPPTSAPTTVVAVTTTTTTTQAPTTTTTVKATTTTAQAPTTTSTTSKPPANSATITVVNEYAHAVTVTINGHSFGALAPGQQAAPVVLALDPNDHDSIGVRVVDAPGCGDGDAGGLLSGPGRYRVTIVTSTNSCLEDPVHPFPGPSFRVTRA